MRWADKQQPAISWRRGPHTPYVCRFTHEELKRQFPSTFREMKSEYQDRMRRQRQQQVQQGSAGTLARTQNRGLAGALGMPARLQTGF